METPKGHCATGGDDEAGVRRTAHRREMRDTGVSKTPDIGNEDSGPVRRQRGARGSPPCSRAGSQAAGRRRRVARSRLAGKASSRRAPRRTELPGEAVLSAGAAPGVWSRAQTRKGVSGLRRLEDTETSLSPTRAGSRPGPGAEQTVSLLQDAASTPRGLSSYCQGYREALKSDRVP